MNKPDIQSTLEPVINAFKQADIPYYIGGSIASSAYGIARATLDVDIIAKIETGDVSFLAKTLKGLYYLDENAIRDAIKNKSSFNLIHLETLFKVDIFIVKNQEYDLKALERKRKDTLHDEYDSVAFYLASCEDIVISKLTWFRNGGEVSERQWLDVVGIIKVQGENLDKEYLHYWSKQLELSELLNKAINEAQENH